MTRLKIKLDDKDGNENENENKMLDNTMRMTLYELNL